MPLNAVCMGVVMTVVKWADLVRGFGMLNLLLQGSLHQMELGLRRNVVCRVLGLTVVVWVELVRK